MRHRTNLNWKLIAGLIGLVFVACCYTPVCAAEEDESGFTMDLGSVLLITLQPDSLHFDASPGDMSRGYTSQQVINARVSSNDDWLVQISGSEALWSGPWDKPVTDLQWKYADGTYAGLTTEPVDVSTGGPANQNTLPIHFRVSLDFANDIPGEYQYEFVLIEITAP